MPDLPSPAISVRATPGTANVRGRLLASADIVVENSGGPFTLVAHAKLGQASPSLGGVAHWEYMPRPVNGGHGKSTLSVATLEPVTPGEQRVIKVRGEQMATAKRWDCIGAVWFDIECELYVEDRGHLTRAMTFTARVALNEARDGFVVRYDAVDWTAPSLLVVALGSCGPDRPAWIVRAETSADRFLHQLTGE